jgi:hypothetical protein
MRIRAILLTPILLLMVVWGAAALWFDGPSSRLAAGLLSATFALCQALLLLWIRPFRRGLVAFALLFLVVLLWWLSIDASNDRDWQADVARLPSAVIEGDRVTISNLRNFDYRTEHDYTERWEQRSYDLTTLLGADIFLSYWGSPTIAHTIMSWEFADGQHLAISIETRKEKGESYSAVLGFFRQYELYYVVADERDVVRLRTNHRGEQVYLYRLRAPAELARAVLVDYLDEVNRLAETPKWYNALTHNCTTTIRHHVQNVAPRNPFSWKILVNGYIDELGYSRATIDTSLPFAELRARSNITEAAKAVDREPDFSARIRQGLPGERQPPPLQKSRPSPTE